MFISFFILIPFFFNILSLDINFSYCISGFHKNFINGSKYLYIRPVFTNGISTHDTIFSTNNNYKSHTRLFNYDVQNTCLKSETDLIESKGEYSTNSVDEPSTISDLLSSLDDHKRGVKQFELPRIVNISGCVQSIRRIHSKNLYFIDLNDGSTAADLQIVVNESSNFPQLEFLKNGDNLFASGTIDWRRGKPTERSICDFDIHIDYLNPSHKLGMTTNDNSQDINPVVPNFYYPYEYLRRYPHLRFRNKRFASVIRIRDSIRKFTSDFFYDKRFVGIDTPSLTTVNCENLPSFKVIDPDQVDNDPKGSGTGTEKSDLNLSSTGQMELEYACYSFIKVWKIGPSFRMETSDTVRHTNEFTMIEAELQNATVKGMIDFIEEFIRGCASYIIKHCEDDINYLNSFNDKLRTHLEKLSNLKITRLTYDEAVKILNELRESDPEKYNYDAVEWGKRLSESNERALLTHFENGVIALTNHPESITPFYMKTMETISNEGISNGNKVVENFDILSPFGYEICGGSLRIHDYNKLKRKMEDRNITGDEYKRYLTLRKYNCIPHGGFGIGFDRLVMLMTMTENIRDVIPFPVYKKQYL